MSVSRALCVLVVVVAQGLACLAESDPQDVQSPRGVTAEPVLIKQPSCERAAGSDFELTGVESHYLRGITQQWLMVAPDANPAMLEMFRDRDRQPRRGMQPWAGEFAGKYLTGAVQVYRVTHDKT